MKSTSDKFSLNGKVVIITGVAGLLGRQHDDAVASFRGSLILLDIPARSCSKGVPDKNLKMLAGHPLIAYSIQVAKKTRPFLSAFSNLVSTVRKIDKARGDGKLGFIEQEISIADKLRQHIPWEDKMIFEINPS